MAHTKSQKAAKGNKDSIAKRLGVKIYGGQKVDNGKIIIRQRGMTFASGLGTKMGKDYTIYAVKTGKVLFGKKKGKQQISVV